MPFFDAVECLRHAVTFTVRGHPSSLPHNAGSMARSRRGPPTAPVLANLKRRLDVQHR